MQHSTDELLGHRIVFALAQVPYRHANGQLIASLAPLMDLETGNTFNGAASTFPADGYVFWGSVARRDNSPGDLIIGTLRQASGSFYGTHDQSWYQVSDADSPHGEVFEYVKTSLDEGTSLRRLVDGRKMIDASHEPPKLFFVWVNEQFVGPFHPQHLEHFQSKTGYCCKPTDVVASVVRVASGEKLSEYVRNEIGYCEVQLSSSTLHPGKGPSGRYSRRYRLIRKEDIVSYSESTQELMLPSDEFAITKACNLLEGRSAKRDAKTVLNRLVEQLRSEERQIESGIADAVVEIVSRSKVLDGVSERIASALATSDVVNARIESSVASRVEQLVCERAAEIEVEASHRASQALRELEQVENELKEIEQQKQQQSEVLEQRVLAINQKQQRLDSLVESTSKRLTQGRNELLSDLSILGPLFHSSNLPIPNGLAGSNGGMHFGTELRGPDLSQQTVTPTGVCLTEAEFVQSRLIPKLSEFGIDIPVSKATDFHALFVAAKMILLPDIGWGIAYAESFGGTATAHCVTIEPDWMNFAKVFAGELGNAFDNAINDPQRVHIVLLDGIDRCPSHAWLRPWFHLVSGWCKSLPNHSNFGWPDNLRLVFSEDRSEASFPLPRELLRWVVPFSVDPSDEPPTTTVLIDGHLPFETWALTSGTSDDFAFDALSKEVQMEAATLDARMRRQLIGRLRDAYLRLGRDEDRILSPIKWLLRLNVSTESGPS